MFLIIPSSMLPTPSAYPLNLRQEKKIGRYNLPSMQMLPILARTHAYEIGEKKALLLSASNALRAQQQK